MIVREAFPNDIPEIQFVRNSVTENTLSDPGLVTDEDCHDYIIRRGKGWVCETENKIVGFSIVSVIDKNVWALFLHPGYERRGIGKKLHDVMIDWYFTQTTDTIWLSTSPGTRAEKFYRTAGWEEKGIYGKGEILFEMTCEKWMSRS